MSDEARRAAEREAAREPGDAAAMARAAAWEKRGRRARCPWAQGPAKVPPEKDFPPLGWGCNSGWDRRLRAWRALPAKERRGCPKPRVRGETITAPVATVRWGASLYIRWSAGDCYWPGNERYKEHAMRISGYATPVTLAVGYWWANEPEAKWSPIVAHFIGTTLADVERFLAERREDYVRRARLKVEQDVAESQTIFTKALADATAFERDGAKS